MLDSRVSEAIADNFGLDAATVTEESSQSTIPEWDSIGHFKLILQLEEVFDVRFPSQEIATLTSAGRIQESLARLNVL